MFAQSCVLVAGLIRLSLEPFLHGGFPFICFTPCVFVAALAAGARAGVGALLYSTALVVGVLLAPPTAFNLQSIDVVRTVAFVATGGILIVVSKLVRALVRALFEREQHALATAREAAHRTRNVLAIVQAIGRQTARGVDSLDEFTTLFDARLTALARAQNLQVEPGADDLMAFVNRAVEPFDSSRFRISGARLPVPPDHAPAVALMIYELATNALKHGALSVPDGLVLFGWRTTGEHLKILWQERGGPPVVAPTRRGFGSRLLASALPPEQGQTTLSFNPRGLTCEITLLLPRATPRPLAEIGGHGLSALRILGAALRRRGLTIDPYA